MLARAILSRFVGRSVTAVGLVLLTLAAIAAPVTAWAQVQGDQPVGSKLSIESDPAAAGKTAADANGMTTGQPGTSVGMKFLIVAALFIGSMMLGNYLSKRFRLPDQGLKFSVIVFSIVASLAVCYFEWPPKLGIDLSGGVILVYGIDESQLEAGQKPDMDKLVAAITKRVNPGGVREVTVRPYGLHEVEIIIPRATTDELDMIKGIIATSGALEFRITANIHDHADIIARAMETKEAKVIIDGEQKARWVPADEDEAASLRGNPDYITRPGPRGQLEVLIITMGEPVTGQYLRNATATYDQTGRPCVTFAFDSRGSQLFGALTTANLPDSVQGFKRHLAIILDGQLITAPSINSAIYDRGEITGNFKQEDTTRLAAVLTAGQLPAVLHREPSTQLLTGPTLGEDTIRKGVESMLISTIVVVIFMVFYYRFAGVVANLAVVLNVLLTLAFMILFHAAFTLSGLAGLALTVGMAVDANVLIYERMREELARGATLRMAIRNGFDRASITIIDANVTTLISAVVLYAIGTDQVKGFAVTLILGIIMNLFTAITVSRAIFDVAEKMRWLSTLRMMKLMSNANYDFIGKRNLAITFSLLLIGIGLVGVAKRGKGLLDIDFTGGVSIEMLFDKKHPQDVAEVRSKLQNLPDVTVQDVHITDEPAGIRFLIVTSEANIEDVEKVLKEKFKGELAYNELQIKDVKSIAAEPAPDAKPEKKAGAALPLLDDRLLALADDAKADAAKVDKTVASDADKPAVEKPATKAADKPGAVKPEAKAAEKPAAPADKPVADKSAADKKPAAEKPAAATPAAEKPSAEKPADKPAAEKQPAAAASYAGGTTAQLTFSEPLSYQTLVSLIEADLQKDSKQADVAFEIDNPSKDYQPGSSKPYKTWDLKIALPQSDALKLLTGVKNELVDAPFFPSSNKIGATVADNTKQQAIYALLASILLIAAYVWFRFTQVMFGLAAILALFHDVLITLGALALSYWMADYLGFLGVEPFKINLTIIAAFLTIIGYSLNDTIVIFDRIREIRGKSQELTPALVNDSINQTLSRTLLTSLTVFLVVVILYAVGGQGIHGFAFALVVGVITGTYSTVYIATPVLIWLNRSGDGRAAGRVSRGNNVATTTR